MTADGKVGAIDRAAVPATVNDRARSLCALRRLRCRASLRRMLRQPSTATGSAEEPNEFPVGLRSPVTSWPGFWHGYPFRCSSRAGATLLLAAETLNSTGSCAVDLAYLRLPPAASSEHLRNAVWRLPTSLIQAMISLQSAHSTNLFVI